MSLYFLILYSQIPTSLTHFLLISFSAGLTLALRRLQYSGTTEHYGKEHANPVRINSHEIPTMVFLTIVLVITSIITSILLLVWTSKAE